MGKTFDKKSEEEDFKNRKDKKTSNRKRMKPFSKKDRR